MHPDLERWAANVGAPLSADHGERVPRTMRGLTVLCWNFGIGTARLGDVLRLLREGALGRSIAPAEGGPLLTPERPLVVLAQEVFRADASVPADCVDECHGGGVRARPRFDIAEVAAAERLNLRYFPSMRNGRDRSDRGNAVLSSLPITACSGIALPHVRQRRIAVTAELAGLPGLRVATAHLDTRGRARLVEDHIAGFGGGRTAQAAALAMAINGAAGDAADVVLGADLNTYLGVRDPAVLTLVRAGFRPAHRRGQWWHTFHGPLPLLLDHVLYQPGDRITGVCVTRLDEAPGDRSRRVFGSDHHPLLARVDFNAAAEVSA